MIVIYLFCGFLLGWSLGANDAANVFGTAVGTRMISFRKAAFICSFFIVLGAVLGGSGTTETLNSLGQITNIRAAALAVFIAALTVFGMTWLRQPVSTSQAIVGSIIGWNLAMQLPLKSEPVLKIFSTWIICPLLSALITIIIYLAARKFIFSSPVNLFKRDAYIRMALLVAGAFGAYSLGANNIANVMGVFVNSVKFEDIKVLNATISSLHQLYFLGGLSIAAGVFSFSKRVMMTVGKNIFHLLPEHAFIVVFSQSVVLFLFSSSRLSDMMISIGLPPFPLVPVSSTQAVIGAVLGIGLMKSVASLKFRILGEIALSWVLTPLVSLCLTFVTLKIFGF